MIIEYLKLTNELTMTQKILTIILPFCGGYFLSYLFRSTNAVISPYLIVEIDINSQQLGMLTSAYLFTFALFQIPLGILLDKYGPRIVQIWLMTIAGFGALLFGLGENLIVLTIARGIIGLGVAGCLMSTFKIITLWYKKIHWPLLYGLCISSGGIGAIVATKPLDFTVELIGWRGAFYILAFGCFLIAFIIRFITPEKQIPKTNQPSIVVLKEIYTSKFFWKIAPITGISGGTGLAIQGLWAGEWLRDVAQFNQNETTSMLLVLNLSLLAGMILIGFLPNLVKKFGASQLDVYFSITLLLLIGHMLLTFEIMPKSTAPWILIGFSANSAVLAYSWLNSQFPISYAGRTSTAINLSLFLCGFILQYAIGWIINFWDRSLDNSYPSIAYTVAFGILLGLQIICIGIFIVLKTDKVQNPLEKV